MTSRRRTRETGPEHGEQGREDQRSSMKEKRREDQRGSIVYNKRKRIREAAWRKTKDRTD